MYVCYACDVPLSHHSLTFSFNVGHFFSAYSVSPPYIYFLLHILYYYPKYSPFFFVRFVALHVHAIMFKSQYKPSRAIMQTNM